MARRSDLSWCLQWAGSGVVCCVWADLGCLHFVWSCFSCIHLRCCNQAAGFRCHCCRELGPLLHRASAGVRQVLVCGLEGVVCTTHDGTCSCLLCTSGHMCATPPVVAFPVVVHNVYATLHCLSSVFLMAQCSAQAILAPVV